ncbi:MAG: methionine synthase [Candidatus Omnitrophica bacterium]|nr:methionine synthase [Candidatus Omnitrophota bacterium]
MSELSGLPTGIGSLPHKATAEALELIFKCCPQIPFWPQLPKRDMREGMLAQFSEGLPCIEISAAGVVFNPSDKEKKLEEFYANLISPESDYKKDPFKINQEYAQGLYAFYQRLEGSNLSQVKYIKCHITGPFTFAASLKNEKGVALLHDPVFMQVIIEGLARKALWQIKFLEEFGKKIIIFIDEPYLGCFGSAYTPINKEGVIKGLGNLFQKIKNFTGVLTGIHCCGNTDWSIFTDIPTLDIINFDAFNYQDKLLLYADNLKVFFNNDRILCWGIVPTQEFSDKITTAALVKKINDGIDVLAKKGVDRGKLSGNLLLSPSCGMGTLTPDKAESILKTLSEISEKIRG